MKKVIVAIALLGNVALVSCKDKDEEIIKTQNIPSAIQTFVNTNFPANKIKKVTLEKENSGSYYDVDLEGGIDLEFNESFKLIKVDSDVKVADTVFPAAIVTYVRTNHPNAFISKWELKTSQQNVELNSGEDLKFNLQNEIIKGNTSVGVLPATVQSYLNLFFPNNKVVSHEVKGPAAKQEVEVDLEGGISLEFVGGLDNNSNSIYNLVSVEAKTALPSGILPLKIVDYVKANYPNLFIKSWELKSDKQEVELSNGLDLEFNLKDEFVKVG